ncbi:MULTISPECIES: OmpA family protein [Vibrio]|uniref:OmpA-like domain-containing protein n=1 Tax=Vibrio proteolyticus NBRC 13287 TaxID=1219065 RepID=U3BCX8_VIBPR|nr:MULTISPECIES: OmpA family protein [Vibrio]NAX22634.1 OmpA family protein [Vibrio sp. V39_P1S14PM300]GAD67624.1 hypothetical protein VPR01S_08_02070 [Vibrio proteolyticus NBRC 13287]
MNKLLLPALIASLVVASNANAEDEYEYTPTPEATQVSDLQDDDNDGVVNARDLCPETPEGAEIDNNGCELYINQSEQLQLHILFANDSSVIEPLFYRQIDEMADFMKEYPETKIEIQGYASKVGSANHNLALSKRRATAVEQVLLREGVEPNRVKIVGYGDTHLSEIGTDETSHAMNRKVVARVVGHKGTYKKEWTIFTKRGQ